MKFSAFVLTVVMAAPAFAADWAPAVSFENTPEIKTPAPAPVSPKDGQNYSGAEELLIMEFGVGSIAMDIPEAEVMRQSAGYQNAFCFEHALRQALTTLLEDHKNSVPLADTLSQIGAQATPTKAELKKARQKLLAVLNTPESFISIVRPYSFNQPKSGERVEKNWIFFLRLNGKNYWAVVDRSGEKDPYIYGA